MKLFDLIALYNRSVTPAASTVHLATWNGHEQPVAVYRSGRFEEWQRWQAQKVFERPYIVGLAKMPERADRWLFVGCFQQLGRKPSPNNPEAWLYDTVELQDVRPLAGRAVIHHPRSGRRSTRHGTSVSERLEVLEIREKPLDVEPFRTYSEVRLMKAELDRIVATDEPSWRVALSAVAGVYVITDTSNGKLYVGSATGDTSAGEGGIWSRWRCYSQTGHGGNDQLIAILAPTQSGLQHARNFQFSILEIADTHANADDVRRREQHWKQVLQSHAHGYNSNL
ncbi:MAG: GIY-YIG nuclease family protein [Nannocystis sp.]|uniref:GIY-YIG nuclease family protein n=1 Tax=Nannocystis sp. TaxID=1962667 RepID=UPI0024223246|nr:GIY-YIG nuclease family protein [Nannocystis sp.]MBK9755803.1 GIY-YIG nuclease family protein [Nannocystis sp.]